jgi:hypothetical protein
VACAHVAALGFTEAAHPPHHATRPAVAGAAQPPELPHTHEDFDRAVRITLNEVSVQRGTRPIGRDADADRVGGGRRVVGVDPDRVASVVSARRPA